MGADIEIVKLLCDVKNYEWGKVGKGSAVAQLYAKNSGEETGDDVCYAELWMGTHDSGPSYVVVPAEATGGFTDKPKRSNLVSLKDWIEQNPSVLGEKVLKKWGASLPFLFKVLSVAKALSIQAHPDKGLAEILHKQQPGMYKDDNHKPEMALALTEYEALCGFVSLEELKTVIQSVPEIVEVVGSSCANQVLSTTEADGEDKVKDVLKSLFTGLMSASESVISDLISKLISRLKQKAGSLTNKEELVLRLEKQYPGDIGLIASFLFNYVKLKPGEALYLGANEPHAYLHGECVECMATSDNVVRAGLTPKHRDVETLCSMLTYKQGFPEILTGVPSNPYTVKYLTPFDEFEVELCNLPQGTSTVFPAVPGPSIFIVMAGEGTMHSASSKGLAVAEGDVLFAAANTEIATESALGLKLCRAGVSSKFFEK
ncbi:mannose-6-phosphate isomerase 2 [Phtheirospermum japonicum]|uniref:Mannose-6-phosphate isomerase n=1 Tax=Phtheirospermum japonicum TaxID=374723 RepID=A0A830CCT1_9LAMI|nr:mannose-6-phosphate isomerase 2 [Phtheirospermum japonicum]